MKSICRVCNVELRPDKSKCTNCGSWNVTPTFKEVESKNGEDADGTITLDKVKAEEAARLITGPWDYCWGGGIVQTSTTLLGGSPGAGKTTLLLQIEDLIAAKLPVHCYEKGEGQCLYIAAEQSLPEIQLTALRLNLKNTRNIRMVPAMGGYANVGEILHKRKPKFVVLDSLQGLCGDDDGAQLAVLDIVKKHAVDLRCPIIVISQVTKDGELAGLNKLQHHVDTTMTFFPDEVALVDMGVDEKGEPNAEDVARILEVRKNRFGRAHISQAFAMTKTGLQYLKDYDNPDEEEEDEED
jgi:DNA repair protein RadA/Sms